ncbi:MAG TPA: TetR/AcrR family transcriptional regulator [Candidatus Binatia bacterium]
MPTRAPRKKRLEPRKKPIQRRSQATVDAILQAAARVFATSGYARTTTNHIARRAGVSIGSLYEYFPSKDAILVALTERHVDEAERTLAAELAAVRASRLPLPDVVRRLVDVMVALHARDPGLHRVLFEEAPLPPRLRARVTALEQAMASEVAKLLEEHGVPPAEAPIAARLAAEVLESLTHRLVVHDDAAPRAAASPNSTFEQQAQEMTLLVTSYLAAKRTGSTGARTGARRGDVRVFT